MLITLNLFCFHPQRCIMVGFLRFAYAEQSGTRLKTSGETAYRLMCCSLPLCLAGLQLRGTNPAILCIYVVRGKPKNISLLIWILIIFGWRVLYKKFPIQILEIGHSDFGFHSESLLMVDRSWLWSRFCFCTSNCQGTQRSVKTFLTPLVLNNKNICAKQFICQIPSPPK